MRTGRPKAELVLSEGERSQLQSFVCGRSLPAAPGQGVPGFPATDRPQPPAELDLHVILDNRSTHKTATVRKWLAKPPRFKLHFAPSSASWLNAVEGWFDQLERWALFRDAFSSVEDLQAASQRFIEVHNEHSAKPFRWNKTAESIISSVHQAKLAAIKHKLLD